jgi:CHAT domain-containing protein
MCQNVIYHPYPFKALPGARFATLRGVAAMSNPFMSDWSNFQEAVLAGTPQREIPDACDMAWQWLDLSAADRRARVAQSIVTETSARWLFMALPFVGTRLRRDFPASGDSTAIDLRLAAVQELRDAVAERFPAAALPPAPIDPRQEVLTVALPALTDAIRNCAVGSVTEAAVAALEAAIESFSAIAATWQAPLPTDHAWWMGAATVALGRAELELGRPESARAAFERAERHYVAAGAASHVDECRERLRALAEARTADFDSAASRQLRILAGEQDPLARASALTTLAGEMRKAGDNYEAARLAEEAVGILTSAGYPDPEPNVEDAVRRWIDTARPSFAGDALLAHLVSMTGNYVQVLGARATVRSEADPDGVERAQQSVSALGRILTELLFTSEAARQLVAARLDFWMTGNAAPPAPATTMPGDDSAPRRAALDDALYRLRLACNANARPELVDEARRLQAEARALSSRIHLVRAELEEAYVLLALQRPADAVPATDAAQRTLLGERAPALGAFTTAHERAHYLNGVELKARALAELREHEALLALCEPVVRDIETERARVSSAYQQSAFLATRAQIYEFCAAAAFRLKRWDLLLATTELLKARASLRSLAASTAPINVAAVQQVLADDEAAVSWFWVGRDTLLVQAFTRDAHECAHVSLEPAQRANYDTYLDAIRAFAGPAPARDAIIAALDELIPPLASVLLPLPIRQFVAGRSRLILCPHRTLHLFPFHAARVADGWLIEHCAVRYVPNLSSLLVPWDGRLEGPVLAVGIGTFDDPGVVSLPNAETEASDVASAHREQGRLSLRTTRAEFVAMSLSDYRCLHLATHGSSVLAGDALNDPLGCGIEFADGTLDGRAIAALELRAELVVLAACDSGQRAIGGRGLAELPGDDMFGLQAVLFDAGAGTLLGALWPVDDESARAILVDFHRAYAAGAPPDRALQSALKAHLADPARRQNLYDWAPFFLTSLGNPRVRAA